MCNVAEGISPNWHRTRQGLGHIDTNRRPSFPLSRVTGSGRVSGRLRLPSGVTTTTVSATTTTGRLRRPSRLSDSRGHDPVSNRDGTAPPVRTGESTRVYSVRYTFPNVLMVQTQYRLGRPVSRRDSWGGWTPVVFDLNCSGFPDLPFPTHKSKE